MSDLVEVVMKAMQAQASRRRDFLSDAMAHALATVAIETIHQHQQGSSPGPATTPGQEPGQETWEVTAELRWFAEQIDQPVQLQQAFRCVEDGRVLWSNVPLVLEREAPAQA